MGRRPFLLVPVAATAIVLGCGLISGLDSLGVDGGEDGALETSVADAGDSATTPDASTLDSASDAPADVDCHYIGVPPKCFGHSCSLLQTCCVTDASACISNGMCGGVTFGCTDPDMCGDGSSCCLKGYTYASLCPTIVEATSMTATFCTVAPASCQKGEDHLCVSNADCPGVLTCQTAVLSTDPSIVFGVCR